MSVAFPFAPRVKPMLTTCGWFDRPTVKARATATHAAAAVATASPRVTQRRRRRGTTFVRSAAAWSRMAGPQPRGRSGRDRGEGEARGGVAELGELLAALLALAEMLLVGVRLVGVERVERVGSGQLVEVHDTSVPGSPSSSRRRESPPNILLLIVPSGWPSRSASSD